MSLLDEMKREAELIGKAMGRDEASMDIALYLIEDGRLPLEEIARACIISMDDAEELAEPIYEARDETSARESIALNLIKAGKNALEEIADACSLTMQRVQELAKASRRMEMIYSESSR